MDPQRTIKTDAPLTSGGSGSIDQPETAQPSVAGVLGSENPPKPAKEMPVESGSELPAGRDVNLDPEPAGLERRAP